MREKMIDHGSRDPGKIERLENGEKIILEGHVNGVGDENFGKMGAQVEEFFLMLRNFSTGYADICREAVEKKTEVVTWLAKLNFREEAAELQMAVEKRLEMIRSSDAIWEKYSKEAMQSLEANSVELYRKLEVLCKERERFRLLASTSGSEMKENLGELENSQMRVKELEERVFRYEARIEELQCLLSAEESGKKMEIVEMQRLVKLAEENSEKERDAFESQ